MSPQHLHLHFELPGDGRWLGADAASSLSVSVPDSQALADTAQTYLLVSGGAKLLSAEHRQLLGLTASLLVGQVVRVVAATDAEAELPLPIEPVPMTKQDFTRFALKHHYTKARAGRAWNTVFFTDKRQPEEHQHLPAVRYVGFAGKPPYGNTDELILDLVSIYERLVASDCRHEVWHRATKADVNFLIHLVNDRLGFGVATGICGAGG